MNDIVIFLKTLSGEDIMGTLATSDTEIIYLHFPVKIEQKVMFTAAGLYTNFIPTLYAPYGKSNTVPFLRNNFQVITEASAFSTRYYEQILSELLYVETKRILMTSKQFDMMEYADRHIHETPQIIQ
jgi:hypothetical protein